MDIEKLRSLAYRIAQECKEVQNTEKPWNEEQWRVLSKAIERLEANLNSTGASKPPGAIPKGE